MPLYVPTNKIRTHLYLNTTVKERVGKWCKDVIQEAARSYVKKNWKSIQRKVNKIK